MATRTVEVVRGLPALAPERAVTWPRRTKAKLANGLEVILAESHTIPRFHGELFFRAGNAAFAERAPGLAEMTATVVRTGTAKRASRANRPAGSPTCTPRYRLAGHPDVGQFRPAPARSARQNRGSRDRSTEREPNRLILDPATQPEPSDCRGSLFPAAATSRPRRCGSTASAPG